MQFDIYKRGSIPTKQTQADARAGKPVSDYYGLLEALLTFDYAADYAAITIPSMLTENQGDQFFLQLGGGGLRQVDQRATRRQGSAAAHRAARRPGYDQPNGPAGRAGYIFDWLDQYLR